MLCNSYSENWKLQQIHMFVHIKHKKHTMAFPNIPLILLLFQGREYDITFWSHVKCDIIKKHINVMKLNLKK